MNQLYRIKPHLLIQAVGDETVILDPESGDYFTLDAVATQMVEQLQQQASPEQIVERITSEYQVDAERVRKDLEELLETMAGQGLVEKVAG